MIVARLRFAAARLTEPLGLGQMVTPRFRMGTTLKSVVDFYLYGGMMRGRGFSIERKNQIPPHVAAIYQAVRELEASYPRNFTPDGHLVGSIGEVVAADALGLKLYPMSRPGHDAYDENGDVQIKMTAGRSVGHVRRMHTTGGPSRGVTRRS